MGRLTTDRARAGRPITQLLRPDYPTRRSITRLPNYSITRFTSFVLIVSVSLACAPGPAAQVPSFTLSVVGTNDLHGGVLSQQRPWRPRAARRIHRKSESGAGARWRRGSAPRRRRSLSGHARVQSERRRDRDLGLQRHAVRRCGDRQSRIRLRSRRARDLRRIARRRSGGRTQSARGAGAFSVPRREHHRQINQPSCFVGKRQAIDDAHGRRHSDWRRRVDDD